MKSLCNEKMESGVKNNEENVIQSLLYLYQEALRENMQDVARVIQVAIESCERMDGDTASVSKPCDDRLKQFYVMRAFLKLNDMQKEMFIQEIESFQRCFQESSVKIG